MFRILAINPGSSSTKIALYDDEKLLVSTNIRHPQSELDLFHDMEEQYEYRKQAILKSLGEYNVPLETIDAIVGRGGVLNPVQSGAYKINDAMLEALRNNSKANAANLGAQLAADVGKEVGAPSYIYDSVSVDEMWDLSRLTGLPGVERTSTGHVLNSKAVARKWGEERGRPYETLTLIVAHLGGGITISLHHMGRMVDMISDDEGPFGPERAGMIPARKLIDYIFSKNFNRKQALDCLQGKEAGLHGLLGTANTLEVEESIKSGDASALLCYQSMAFHVAQYIGQLATEVNGKVDQIILTGGTAHSDQFTKWVEERVSFIAPVNIQPGDRELEAMAMGILQVLRGQAVAKQYDNEPRPMLLEKLTN